MIFRQNRLPADDSHEISCLICYFWKSSKILNCCLLQIKGGALLWVNNYYLYISNSALEQWKQLNYQTDPGVASSIPARSHTFVEIDHEIISMVILLLPLIYSRRVVVSYKRKYVHELLVNPLFKPAQEKVWLVNWPSRNDHSCWLGT